ncbi:MULTISPECIES: hypothetical protein [unclassified Mesorhizobium]|uniref:hypothetical protein n=1 Tax=unclassified Mesorhizobium TaxID=325217 RepID=UPI001FEFF498|nr:MULTISPECIES: hypothetical protein [unclassified Mesorhizobium]
MATSDKTGLCLAMRLRGVEKALADRTIREALDSLRHLRFEALSHPKSLVSFPRGLKRLVTRLLIAEQPIDCRGEFKSIGCRLRRRGWKSGGSPRKPSGDATIGRPAARASSALIAIPTPAMIGMATRRADA